MTDDEQIIKLKPSQTKLLNHAAEIRENDVFSRTELGFSSRIFVQCSLPHRDPGDDLPEWMRVNGKLCLTITPVRYMKDGQRISVGYPYGNIPRLLLLYVCTQAIQTKSKVISLGDTLSQFMHNVDLEVTGGRWGTVTRFKDQFNRLFRANIDFTFDGETHMIGKKANLAHTIQLWWDIKQPEQSSFFNSYVELTEEFYNEIMTYPVPVDMGLISTIKQSPLALDLYTWLTHRVVSINKPTRISWESIASQVGSEYSEIRNFMTKTKEALAKLYALWPELKIDEVKGGIILKPSKPSVRFIE